jgi:hypothetical protein
MRRPVTPHDIDAILDRLERMPRLGRAFHDDPTLRERLRLRAQASVEKFMTPPSAIERLLRTELRERIGWQ